MFLRNKRIDLKNYFFQAFLNWNHENMHENTKVLLKDFIENMLQPLLIWKAGRNAESIRAMATQAIYSIGCTCIEEAQRLFPKLAKHFNSLIEDDLAVTRAYAIRCVLCSGPFLYEDYRQLSMGG